MAVFAGRTGALPLVELVGAGHTEKLMSYQVMGSWGSICTVLSLALCLHGCTTDSDAEPETSPSDSGSSTTGGKHNNTSGSSDNGTTGANGPSTNTNVAASSQATSTGGGNTSNGATTGGGTGGTSTGSMSAGNTSNTVGGTTGGGGGLESAKQVAQHLGRSHFLIGMGNDLNNDHNLDGAYTLGVTLDLHYAYLVGLPGQGGWPDWNADGTFVNILTDSAKSHGVAPMFTLYSMASAGEGNLAALTDAGFMGLYWSAAKLMFERLGVFGEPAVVHFEPDFWGIAQQGQADPTQQAVLVGSVMPDCADQPENMVGMGQCLIGLARQYAPETLVGFHASRWANPDPQVVADYLTRIGAGMADIVVTETLDRDAGCFEVGNDPNCTRNDGPWYWDETNQTSPNFHEHLAWAKAISDGVGKPILWWQMPFGVPHGTPGGSPGAYRDNRVKYLFEHVDEFVAAGGVGAVFGVGAANQTYIDSDGGQFQNAVTKYFSDPYQL